MRTSHATQEAGGIRLPQIDSRSVAFFARGNITPGRICGKAHDIALVVTVVELLTMRVFVVQNAYCPCVKNNFSRGRVPNIVSAIRGAIAIHPFQVDGF